ncbi:hypothetical protein H9P43_006302 [Blastocladiella emersonii ATCC 22665]|nr:hypothetical protein H9P43_006302 [Blastocladiella emersonii ATCC 22665]
MNTPGSVAYGWGALIIAGAVAYNMAKKDIDAQRREQAQLGVRPIEELSWQDRIRRDEERLRQQKLQEQAAASGGSASAGSASGSA